jgi:hypothetical protein
MNILTIEGVEEKGNPQRKQLRVFRQRSPRAKVTRERLEDVVECYCCLANHVLLLAFLNEVD